MSQLLDSVIDLHAHCAPDSIERSLDSFDLAKLARQHGMRGVVLKNHFEPTASQAYLVRKYVPGLEVFGGITLNLAIGGMNPSAVEHMAQVSGGLGRIVWMGSFDTEAHVRYEGKNRRFVSISQDGGLREETCRVINAIARHNLILATGHTTPEDTFLLIHEAQRQGVSKIVVTHAMMAPIHMSIAQMQQAAALGAFIEFAFNGLVGAHKEFDFADYATAIRAVGPAHCILVSDLGQAANPLHPDGLLAFFAGLAQEKISNDEIELMTRANPAHLLGLD